MATKKKPTTSTKTNPKNSANPESNNCCDNNPCCNERPSKFSGCDFMQNPLHRHHAVLKNINFVVILVLFILNLTYVVINTNPRDDIFNFDVVSYHRCVNIITTSFLVLFTLYYFVFSIVHTIFKNLHFRHAKSFLGASLSLMMLVFAIILLLSQVCFPTIYNKDSDKIMIVSSIAYVFALLLLAITTFYLIKYLKKTFKKHHHPMFGNGCECDGNCQCDGKCDCGSDCSCGNNCQCTSESNCGCDCFKKK